STMQKIKKEKRERSKEKEKQRKPMENKVPEEGKRTSGKMNGEGAPQAEGKEAALKRNTN
ncbi:unnamed protein product, partial [Orchesella dallaii]